MSSGDYRIGRGTDRHRFVEGRPLILAGVEIEHDRGLLGHSDADAVLHAVSEALFGALADGDIGQHFPNSDPEHEGLDSKKIVKFCMGKLKEGGWKIKNLDVVIHAEAPKMAPHALKLRESLAALLECELDQVSVKSKTAEGLGPVGEGLCLDAEAVVLIQK
jgi:2-C-methyl-D-erythritol 2,4-cyclodiphosphate synthase